MKVIAFKQLPSRLPIQSSIVIYLLMDRLNAGALAWGIVGTLLVIVWLAAIYQVYNQEQTEIKL